MCRAPHARQVKFEDLKTKIETAVERLNLSATVDTAVITQARFQQTENLKRKIEELGGAEKVASDPNTMKQFEQHMDASDRIISASVNQARKDLRAIGEDVKTANEVISAIESTQRQQILETQMSFQRMSVSQEDHSKKLDEVTDSFVQLQQSHELQRLQNDMLKQQVNELKSMLSEVKDAMNKVRDRRGVRWRRAARVQFPSPPLWVFACLAPPSIVH